jgi:hypothetical protein
MIVSKRAFLAAALMLVLAEHRFLPSSGERLLLKAFPFTLAAAGEVVASISARCDACAWDMPGRESVALLVVVDGRYRSHVPLVRSGRADYTVLLGPLNAGAHAVNIRADLSLTSEQLRNPETVAIEAIGVTATPSDDPASVALSLAPILHARRNTIGAFTDVPVFMWYEREPTPRSVRYRYSVIFTNEDGGTPTDRLMSTWGRTTDIEYVYSVEVDSAGKIVEDDLQGPDHKILPFTGKRDGRHPLLFVSTDNNMVRDTGEPHVRYALAPVEFPLNGVSREAVMDANPWLYEVSSRELVREGKIVENAPPGKSAIPDPRHFVYVEACGEVGTAALSFDVAVGDTWIPSDRGIPQYKIVRNGCFRGAVPVPSTTKPNDVRALRFVVSPRVSSNGATSGAPGPVTIERVNKVFMLDEHYVPRTSIAEWKGPATVNVGSPLEIKMR